MDTECTVPYELRAGVAWLGLNRPDRRNAIDEALLAQFEATVRWAQDEARALVVFGHGPCFSAGLDLAEQRTREPAEVFHHSSQWHAAFSLLRHGRISRDRGAARSDNQGGLENTERSVARGSFGSPTFFVGDEIFFWQGPAARCRGNDPGDALPDTANLRPVERSIASPARSRVRAGRSDGLEVAQPNQASVYARAANSARRYR
jgi:hypothetical protein